MPTAGRSNKIHSQTSDLTIEEFAQAVNKSHRTIRTQVEAGSIPHYKTGGSVRIPHTHLEDLRASAFGDYTAEIERLVDAAPKLTDAQIDQLLVLLAPASKGPRRAAGRKS